MLIARLVVFESGSVSRRDSILSRLWEQSIWIDVRHVEGAALWCGGLDGNRDSGLLLRGHADLIGEACTRVAEAMWLRMVCSGNGIGLAVVLYGRITHRPRREWEGTADHRNP